MEKLTERDVRKLTPRHREYQKCQGDGFGVRVYSSGRKAWILVYRRDGQLRRLTLGQVGRMPQRDALVLARKARTKLDRGVDPVHERRKKRAQELAALTVTQLADRYMEGHAKPKKRSWKEDLRYIEKDVLPFIGRLKAKDVQRKDILRLLDTIRRRGAPVAANRTLAVVRRMYSWGISCDLVQTSPCSHIERPSREHPRDRVLSAREISVLWRFLDSGGISERKALALKLVLVTAQRVGEVCQMRWSEIDETIWTIPAIRAKNGLAHRVPLSPLALEILSQVRKLAGRSSFAFPSPGDCETMPIETLSAAIRQARRRTKNRLDLDGFTPHDLRRTAASHLASMGVSRLVISKLLNHAEPGVTAVYDRHSYDKEKREALLKLAGFLAGRTLAE